MIGAGCVAGCSKPNNDPPPASKPITPPAVPEGTPTKVDVPKSTGLPAASTDLHAMIGNMTEEAQHRPRAGVLAEPLFDALEDQAHLKLAQRNQYMGQTMHASFCAGGQVVGTSASQALTVAMCEYPDDAAANASLDYMNKTFHMGNARREEHKAAVMTIVASAGGDPRVDLAFKVFESL